MISFCRALGRSCRTLRTVSDHAAIRVTSIASPISTVRSTSSLSTVTERGRFGQQAFNASKSAAGPRTVIAILHRQRGPCRTMPARFSTARLAKRLVHDRSEERAAAWSPSASASRSAMSPKPAAILAAACSRGAASGVDLFCMARLEIGDLFLMFESEFALASARPFAKASLRSASISISGMTGSAHARFCERSVSRSGNISAVTRVSSIFGGLKSLR